MKHSTKFLIRLCEEGQVVRAVQAVELMHKQGYEISLYVFYCLLKGCSRKRDLSTGRRVRSLILSSSKHSNKTLLGSHLIHMFSSVGSLPEALHEFRRFPETDAHMWSGIISACVKHGRAEQAINLYKEMRCVANAVADSHTFVAVLNACARVGDLTQGRLIHAHIQESGLELDPFVGSSLLDMYGKCGSLNDARQVFLVLRVRDVVCWTSMIDACAEEGCCEEALHLFECMKEEGVVPNKVTFVCLLKACREGDSLQQGRHVHEEIVSKGWEMDMELGNALIDMYVTCGDLGQAYRFFLKLPCRNVVSWTTMISGLAEHELNEAAFQLFAQMQEDGVEPNKLTFMGLLKACCNSVALEKGKVIHAHLVSEGMDSDLTMGNILIDMYGKCGSILDAQKSFLKLPERDIVSWNAIINGCAHQGWGKEALKFFNQMMEENVQPDKITFLALLSACSHSGLIHDGISIFYLMTKHFGILPTMDHYTCMIDLLGREGKLNDAYDVMETMLSLPNA